MASPARLALVVASVFVLAADCAAPVETPTFTALRDDVFTPRCGTTGGCHGDNPARGLDLLVDPHGAMVGVASVVDPAKSYVVAGDPDASLLMAVLRGDVDGPGGAVRQMPPGFALPEETLAQIEAWIAAGAPND